MVTFSPMWTCDDMEMAWIVQLGPAAREHLYSHDM